MCIKFLGLAGDKELVSLPKSLLFSCFKQQRIFNENSRTFCSFLSFFIFLIYLHISVRKVEESGNFLIGWLFTFVIYTVPSSSRYFRRKCSLSHQKGKLFYVLFHVWICTLWGSSSGWFLTPVSAALSFCLLPWCSMVHTGQGADMGICVRNASWEVTHLATDSLSIPVPFHSCVDVHISHCSNAFCLSLLTLLARLANGAAHFLIWPFIWGQILIGSRCDGPLCRAKSGCWQTEKFQEKKKKSCSAALLFPLCSSPNNVKAMYWPSPGSPQHILGWIPFLINAELCSMKSGSLVRAFLLHWRLRIQCSAAGTWWRIRKSFVWLWANQIVSHAGFILTKSGVFKVLSAKVKL